jgi:hypothetical protein
MEQENYIAAIKKQQSLIRRLFSSRNRRSEVIQQLTEERYRHLIGRFFRPQGERFKNIDCDIDYYICGIATESNYVMSDEVHLILECRFIGHDYCGIPCDYRTLRGICICNRSFRFEPDEDIDAILAPMWVDKVKAIKEIDNAYGVILKNLLKVNKD